MLNVGWREKVYLPKFSQKPIKAKIDTGAKSSALHVTDLTIAEVDGQKVANFRIYVGKSSKAKAIEVCEPVYDIIHIKSSNGQVEERPLIRTQMSVGGESWLIDVTLTNRSKMKYRMLIGRDAMEDKMLVHPSKSYLLG
jgi:hypothetical protein